MKAILSQKFFILIAVTLLLLVFNPSLTLRAEEKKIPESHPIELDEKPVCTECHTDETGAALKPINTFVHGSDWSSRHRYYASQTYTLCNACHKVSFCTDCHAYKGDLKPSDKYPGSPERWLPHRGNYIYQHRIDGRIDPTGCFRCHGRQNNMICRGCHKR